MLEKKELLNGGDNWLCDTKAGEIFSIKKWDGRC
jgi:hypothetical protein